MHRAGSRASRERAMLEWIEVRESPLHGRGVFARRALRRNQRIGLFEGEATTRNGSYVLWVTDDAGREIGIRGRNVLRFLNHGCPPNAEFRDEELFVLAPVEKGAELLIDYGDDEFA